MAIPTDIPEPDPGEVDRVLSELERSLTEPAADGYTSRVRDLEALVAEADRVRDLPTEKVLARQQELAEAADIEALATREHVRTLQAAGDRERATLAAKAVRAAARRRLATDPNIEALALTWQCRGVVALLWVVLVGAMAVTAVNVQRFVAGDAPAWSPAWLVGWLLDPALSLLVVALLLAGGFLAGKDHFTGRQKGLTTIVEAGALLSCLAMNVAPEIDSHAPWGLVVGHSVMPLAALGATLMIPIVQQRFRRRIDALSALDDDRAVDPTGRGLTSMSRGSVGGAVGGRSGRSVEELRAELIDLANRDSSDVDINSAESIRRHLRCGMARARQLRDEFTQNPQ